ncbi:MAG: Ribosomal large subunit pseudouridine synthase D [Parcubacteria group bacterium Gr01-1014_20]|nr:MAG: Ribosomal large subunit pseudouridine synthase D [Parcubacteria group bacterium Gr01-1014_20]
MKHEIDEKTQIVAPRVVYEERDFLVINKPSGLLVHKTTKSSSEATLVDWLLMNYPEVRNVGDNKEFRPGIVHRLDKATSGVMIVPRNQEYFEYIKNLFREKGVKKTYLALVYGKPKDKIGVIDKPIGLKPGSIKRTVFGGKMKKEAVTEYKLVSCIMYHVSNEKKKEKPTQEISLLEVTPKTGRTHQIRVHLASVGCPVLNDSIYAPKREKVGTGRLMLHALTIEFIQKNGRGMRFEADPPKEFGEIIRGLESGRSHKG